MIALQNDPRAEDSAELRRAVIATATSTVPSRSQSK